MSAAEIELPTSQVPEVHDYEHGRVASSSSGRRPSQPPVDSYRKKDAPDEVVVFSDEAEYKEYRQLTDLREPYHIPTEYLVGTKKFVGLQRAEAPLVVFINAKSGGRVGPRLATVLFHALGQGQVFDLADTRPAPVLKTLWDNLKEREAAGDKKAGHIRRNLRILAAGGDGTVTWILKTIHDLGLDPLPAVGVMPLGTGNDLSLSFGWGNAFLNKWIRSQHLYRTLKRFADADIVNLDAWRLAISAPSTSFFHELPHSLQLDQANQAGPSQVSGWFWNYFSIGLDAEAAYGFHRLRENKPWAASTRLANQAWYSFFSCTSGWFCGAPPLVNKLRLRVKDRKGQAEWREVEVPKSVRALVLLNLQSYGGGRDLWGLSDNRLMAEKGFSDPIFDDGIIEVVGLGSGWHTALVMGQITPKVHAVRLAQCAEAVMELAAAGGRRGLKGEQGLTHMQLDGEPWAQRIPEAGHEPLRVHVSCAAQSHMLFNTDDIQGGLRVKRLAQRGAEKKRSTKSLGAVGGSEGASAPRSTLTERGTSVNGTGLGSDEASNA